MTGIRTTSHSDSPVILNRMEDRTSDDQIQVADGSFIPIEGSGTLLNHTTGLISQFQNTLLSVNRTNVSNNAIAIFTETDCHVIKLNKQILNILYKLLNKAKSSNSILLNGDVVNGLYICEIEDIEKSPSLNTCTFRYNTSHDINAPIYDDINLPTSNHIKRANSSYYSNVPSVHLDSLKELVRYFHEAWNHASSELMCLIIKHQLILNLPPQLTEKVVRKYHPNCNACPAGNLQRRPFMSLPVTRYMEEGEEWECDIMGPFTDKNGKRCRTFSGNLYALTCKDLKTRKRQGYLLKNKGYLLRYIKHLITFNSLHNRTIRILRMDDEFYTQEILDYLAIKHILPLNCIPHEHETLGNSERDNRTIREVVLKNLADKPHLDERYWGMCYKDILSKMDLMPCPDDPTNNPYLLWFKKKFDLLRQPTIPFGSIVRAHVPLAQQSMLKERSIITYYVGYNNDRHGGILLFNPKTKQTIIRKSYRVMGPIIQPDSTISYEAPYEEDGQLHYNDEIEHKDIIIPINITPTIEPILSIPSIPIIESSLTSNSTIPINTRPRRKCRDKNVTSTIPIETDEYLPDHITLKNTKLNSKVDIIVKSVDTVSNNKKHISWLDDLDNSIPRPVLPVLEHNIPILDDVIQVVEPVPVLQPNHIVSRVLPPPYTSWIEYMNHLVAEDIKLQRLEHPDWYPEWMFPPEDYEDIVPIVVADTSNINNRIPPVELISTHQFGNDYTEENDPLPIGSKEKLKVHIPKPPPLHEIESDHCVVEKILNHKGQSDKPWTMKLYVKWFGWHDSKNEWIKWEDNQNLAALDTYLANNPEIIVPYFSRKEEIFTSI